MERVRWLMDDGQTDRKTDDGQTVLKMMNHLKRYVPCKTYLFQGTTSCTKLRTFLQAESAFNNTHVEYVPQNVCRAKLHDKCMISVFCLQFTFVDN